MKSNFGQFSNRQLMVMFVIAAVGLSLSGYLTVQSFGHSGVAGCSGQVFDCDHVLKSHWSKLLGIPVSVFAVGTYVLLIGAIVGSSTTNRRATRERLASLITGLSLAAGFAAFWFVSLQAFVLQHFCWYCLTAHACGISVAVISLVGNTQPYALNRLRIGACSFGLVTLIAVLQIATPQAPTFILEEFPQVSSDFQSEEIEAEFISPFDDVDLDVRSELIDEPETSTSTTRIQSNSGVREAISATAPYSAIMIARLMLTSRSSSLSNGLLVSTVVNNNANRKSKKRQHRTNGSKTEAGRVISILNGSLKLNTSHWPIIGDPAADTVIVELFDYTCPHCRQTSSTLQNAKKQRGKKLAIVALPVPMHTKCNDSVKVNHPKHAEACELANIAIAVWLTSPGSFEEFHNWMMKEADAPTAEQAMNKAVELVDKKQFAANFESNRPSKCIASTVKIYKRAGAGSIPKLVFPRSALVGKVSSLEIINQMIDQNLGK